MTGPDRRDIVWESESFCAYEDLPPLDPSRDELFRRDPGIVRESAVDLALVFCVHDKQHTDAPVLGFRRAVRRRGRRRCLRARP